MAEPSTYIKLDRNISKWRWYQDANTTRLFIHLLLNANIEPRDFQKVTIQRGELATSYAHLAQDLGLSVQNIRTALEHLKSTGEVTSTKYSKFQVISIVNYGKYQNKPTDNLTGNQHSTNTQLTGNQQQLKNDKNIRTKELKKDNIYADKPPRTRFIPPTVDEVKAYCIERGNTVDAERFIDYYTSNGWMVGKNKMKDWKSAVRMWERNGIADTKPKGGGMSANIREEDYKTDVSYYIEN